ncbi:MAG: DNA translocase FtsK 4TM domain-containing protein [Gammaproteobacteria bacterium]
MSKKGKKPASTPWRSALHQGLRESILILFAGVALYFTLALASYHPADPGWSHSADRSEVLNHGGRAGAWIADILLYLFGYLAYLFPVLVGYAGWLVFRGARRRRAMNSLQMMERASGFLLTLATGSGLATLYFRDASRLPLDAGGVLGKVIGDNLTELFNTLGGTLCLLTLFATGITLFTGISWLTIMDAIGRYTVLLFDWLQSLVLQGMTVVHTWRVQQNRRVNSAPSAQPTRRPSQVRMTRIEPTIERSKPVAVAPPPQGRQLPLLEPPRGHTLPSIALLDSSKPTIRGLSDTALAAISEQVELKLKDFGIDVRVVAVHPGPVVTRFELEPAPGVKVSRISNLAKDLARSLSTFSVRIVEVIPGKSVIGLEIPNEQRELVTLSEILISKAYEDSTSPLSLALGKDIAGHPVVMDLGRMPHLLVAGTTGSGKSVAINAMVLSLLYKVPAADVRLIMVDPKVLELSVYEGIPHLLAPVVTDPKDAANALRWCVAEMERRYRLMSALSVRNLASYNRKIKDALARGPLIRDPLSPSKAGNPEPEALEPLALIVVIVDELADLMMVAGKKVEELIARLAQKARASGIHLILATQRPSVDVITGLIKANIPSRIAFQVSSKIDSRTILDQSGAEQLLGHGDMLYLTPGMATPMRVHGAFVRDHEVHEVVESLRGQSNPQYLEDVLKGGGENVIGADAGLDGGGGEEHDALFDQAVRLVTETRRASISGVQRRLKIGYNRAARMVEDMEQAGIVGPLQSNGNREVLAPPPPEL